MKDILQYIVPARKELCQPCYYNILFKNQSEKAYKSARRVIQALANVTAEKKNRLQ